MRLYLVTGTFHGAHVYARCEGDARRIFHEHYNGESIISVYTQNDKNSNFII